MPELLTCARCQREVEALAAPPMPGPLGQEVQQRVCPACWAEWQQMEIMVINELKLNFMDPAAQGILDQNLREFLGLGTGSSEAT